MCVHPPMKFPALLAAGARVALVAPAGPLRDETDLERAITSVRACDWEPVVGTHVLERDGYLAGSDPHRLADLNRFEDGAEVTPEALRENGLAKRRGVPVKLLAQGELERKKLTVSVHGFSAAAREKIEAAGGSCNVVEIKRGANR